MKGLLSKIAGVLIIFSLAGGMLATAQADSGQPAVRLPVSGTFRGGGDFTGSVSINKFELRGEEIFAVGFVSGVLSRGNRTIGSVVAGEVSWPVTLRAAGPLEAGNREITSSSANSGIGPAQETCSVLEIGLGPVDVNLLGFQVSLGAITFNIFGEGGTPLGDLVCAILALLDNVAAVVELLNSLLGLLTGLLGGLLP